MNESTVDGYLDVHLQDLAEIRKLVDGMNAIINSQAIQQQYNQASSITLADSSNCDLSQDAPPCLPSSGTLSNVSTDAPNTPNWNNTEDLTIANVLAAAIMAASAQNSGARPEYNPPQLNNSIVVEVHHLGLIRTLYFQITVDATIESLIAWLRLSFQDPDISGMVLQYKGFDGLWKCLLNRDDSLKRILKQNLKANSILYIRVPQEQDLLNSGYTDRRLLALTKSRV
ncbi:uncharacterized protein BYT42DRAFT_562694 [Radiomyces spectabilis]|uniref:uncharacterized protein n=1 Tax=Radiomyces spectabilis TaxID=64574 RepID=UPI002220DE43|nr:uncharacterized protein BYT42DRAFT_562694 [Radiomyces spectabilis]KAI8384490.1 hypothetical protein BYT42DRAFT_562694 [Radiomyces spectabilis]